MSNVILLPTAKGANTPVDLFLRVGEAHDGQIASLKPRKGQTAEQAAENLVRRLIEHAQRNEKMRSSLENLHSVRGLDLPRAPAAHLSPRVRASDRKR
jgi:hypothetical protein